MRIYYFVSNKEKKTPTHHEMYRLLLSRKAEVFSNVDVFNTARLSNKERVRLEQTGEFLISKMNAVVIEANELTNEVQYVVMLAVGQRLPVLCLYNRSIYKKQAFASLLQDKRAKRFVTLQGYLPHRFSKMIMEFVSNLDVVSKREKVALKFTLRITPRLSRYLEWRAVQENMSKADYLREKVLDNMMEQDEEYIAYQLEREKDS